MFLIYLRWFLLFKSFIFVYSISKLKALLSTHYYGQQFTVFMSPCVFQFFVKFCKNSSLFRYNVLLDMVVCDHMQSINRFSITYVIGSPFFSARFYIRVLADIYSFVNSVGILFWSALWLEREAYDMFGLFFLGHPDLRRILTDYGFNGFPLQKDFPLVGFVEKQFVLSENVIISRPVVLVQEFRFTD